MKKLIKPLLFAGLLLGLSGCARSITMNYRAVNNNSGTLVLEPSSPTANTAVFVNDTLVLVEGKWLKKVILKNMPEGNYRVKYVSWAREEKPGALLNVKIQPGQKNTQELSFDKTGWGPYVGQQLLSGLLGITGVVLLLGL